MAINNFSNEVCEKIGYYVYRLIDPRNGETFYVGKGKNNRVFEHVAWAKKGLDFYKLKNGEDDEQSLKIKRIQDILYEGLEVIHIIHRWGMTETEALHVEAALMEAYPGLTNIQGGYHSDNGTISATSLQRMFEKETFIDRDDIKYLIIKVRKSVIEDRGSVYEAVRRSWKVSLNNVQAYPFILAVENGILNIYGYRIYKCECKNIKTDKNKTIYVLARKYEIKKDLIIKTKSSKQDIIRVNKSQIKKEK